MAIKITFDEYYKDYLETFGGLSWTRDTYDFTDIRTGKTKTTITWRNSIKGSTASLALEKTCFQIAKRIAKAIDETSMTKFKEILRAVRNVARNKSTWEYSRDKNDKQVLRSNFREVSKFMTDTGEAYWNMVDELKRRGIHY